MSAALSAEGDEGTARPAQVREEAGGQYRRSRDTRCLARRDPAEHESVVNDSTLGLTTLAVHHGTKGLLAQHEQHAAGS